jgi:ribosomal protein S18 acetylase RimI-like enzyme
MDIRQANVDDVAGIREVARRSMEASYGFLDPELVDAAVEQWYDDDGLERSIAGSDEVVVVGTVDGEVVGFSQSSIVGEDDSIGELRWIHVDPDRRGQGIGDELLDRTREVLRGQGVGRIRGVVLAGNEDGAEFYEDHGFERRETRELTIDDRTYEEILFETGASGKEIPPPRADVESIEVDGESGVVFFDEGERGSEGQFHPIYHTRQKDDLYGWFCGVCTSTDNAMDSMGRLECNECGNILKPTRWDAAYL